jgi:hypothetical protein
MSFPSALFPRTQSARALLCGFFALFSLWIETCTAQQNLFNIPSGSITPRRELFYQHQVNFYSINRVASKQHVVVGLGEGWEVGFNLVNLSLDFRRPEGRLLLRNDLRNGSSLKPKVHATAQKQWTLSESIRASLGTQNGFNMFADPERTYYAFFHYGLFVWSPRKHTNIVAGTYHGSRSYLGNGNDTGFMLGFEYPLSERFLLMGDFISGRNQESVGVLGFNWYATPRFQICLGGILPSPGSRNEGGVVLEINLLTYTEH